MKHHWYTPLLHWWPLCKWCTCTLMRVSWRLSNLGWLLLYNVQNCIPSNKLFSSSKLSRLPSSVPRGQSQTRHPVPWRWQGAMPAVCRGAPGMYGLQSHICSTQHKEPMMPHLRSCHDVAKVACLAVDPKRWPFGLSGQDTSSLVGLLMATMQAHEMVLNQSEDLNATLDSTLNSTLNASFCHPVLNSVVVQPKPGTSELNQQPPASQ